MTADPMARWVAIGQGVTVAVMLAGAALIALTGADAKTPASPNATSRAASSTIGRTWPIAEPDAMAEIEARVATLPRDMMKQFGPRSKWSALRAASLGVAPTDRTRTVIPFHTLEFDIKLPDGRMLYPKGYSFNPLTYLKLPQRLVIVHPRDLNWALKAARPTDFLIVTAGDAIELTERTGRAIYLLEERVKERLGLTVAPVIVTQAGPRLVLTEVGPRTRGVRPVPLARQEGLK
ncbi:conjugal transfer protein TraW [Sphingomonas sp. MG17]|uniref:Conjugal transfer protein TraW n=1 Tax=Sphingomonas tagetis TaxID=2949092 RepID=A0A9X2KMC5_9SPHN|nr:conjugal transfer protein TraW [Sphingomonas tagetis]MCP3731336.1 conjugal transfer protein TraW [Sphingomonas tagetis]